MEVKTKNLPDNIEVLKHMILELSGEVSLLKNRLYALLRNSYGTKSEKFDPNQLTLFAELLEDVKQAQSQEQSRLVEPVNPPGESDDDLDIPDFLK